MQRRETSVDNWCLRGIYLPGMLKNRQRSGKSETGAVIPEGCWLQDHTGGPEGPRLIIPSSWGGWAASAACLTTWVRLLGVCGERTDCCKPSSDLRTAVPAQSEQNVLETEAVDSAAKQGVVIQFCPGRAEAGRFGVWGQPQLHIQCLSIKTMYGCK